MPDLTQTDLLRLEAMRIDRFNDRIAHILCKQCMVCLIEEKLLIYCECPSQIDALIEIADQLTYFARVVVGAKAVALRFAKEQVWQASTRIETQGIQCSQLGVNR